MAPFSDGDNECGSSNGESGNYRRHGSPPLQRNQHTGAMTSPCLQRNTQPLNADDAAAQLEACHTPTNQLIVTHHACCCRSSQIEAPSCILEEQGDVYAECLPTMQNRGEESLVWSAEAAQLAACHTFKTQPEVIHQLHCDRGQTEVPSDTAEERRSRSAGCLFTMRNHGTEGGLTFPVTTAKWDGCHTFKNQPQVTYHLRCISGQTKAKTEPVEEPCDQSTVCVRLCAAAQNRSEESPYLNIEAAQMEACHTFKNQHPVTHRKRSDSVQIERPSGAAGKRCEFYAGSLVAEQDRGDRSLFQDTEAAGMEARHTFKNQHQVTHQKRCESRLNKVPSPIVEVQCNYHAAGCSFAEKSYDKESLSIITKAAQMEECHTIKNQLQVTHHTCRSCRTEAQSNVVQELCIHHAGCLFTARIDGEESFILKAKPAQLEACHTFKNQPQVTHHMCYDRDQIEATLKAIEEHCEHVLCVEINE